MQIFSRNDFKKIFQLTLGYTSIKQIEMSVVIRTSAMHV